MANDGERDTQPAEQIRMRLERLARLMRQTGHAAGLNPVQWEALRYLARANDPPPGNLVIWRGLSRLNDIQLGVSLQT